MELPVVDISPFLQTDKTESSADAKKDCAKTLFDACHDTGFLYLKDHGIPSAITDEVLALARSFFLHASEEEKMSIARLDAGVDDGDSARGWQRLGDNVTKGLRDWHEAVDYYREEEGADGPPYKPLLGRNRWPKAPLRLRAAFEDYISRMLELGTAVVRAMGYALDPSREDVFVEQTRRSFWVLRMIGYPPLESSSAALHDGGETGISCGEHTDYGCLTFLLADSTQGALEVRHRSGTWIKADPLPGAFVVNIGDMIERWTNGLWKSTPHRVIHRGVNDWRISVPFFFEPDFDARVKPLTKFAEEAGGLPKYDEVLYGPYLQRKVESNFY
ncbi:MAG: hypothetical protein M1815_006126 [Lichina confinis]|nr:MAG: hypothetical protein M1815_006126 [Lichina confinis]